MSKFGEPLTMLERLELLQHDYARLMEARNRTRSDPEMNQVTLDGVYELLATIIYEMTNMERARLIEKQSKP